MEPRSEMTNSTMASSQHLTGTEAHLIYHPTASRGDTEDIHPWVVIYATQHDTAHHIGRGIILVAVMKLQYEEMRILCQSS